MGACQYCGQSAGFLRKQHGQCRDLHTAGIQEMTQLAAQAASTGGFSETALRNTLQAIADPGPGHPRNRHLPGHRRRLGPGRQPRHAGRHPHRRRGNQPQNLPGPDGRP